MNKKLLIVKTFTQDEVEYVEGTEIEVSAEFASELIEKELAQEVEVKESKEEVEVKDDKIDELASKMASLEEKLTEFKSKEQKGNKIMNIEVKDKMESPEQKLAKSVKLAKALATNIWDEETKSAAGQNIATAGDGGALVDPLIIDGIYANAIATSKILPKVQQRPVGANHSSFKIKQLNEPDGTPANYNGIQLDVIAEGNAITPRKLAYTSNTVAINKLAAVIPFTNEILEDVPGVVPFTESEVGKAFGLKVDEEILYGTESLLTATVGHAGSRAFTLADASAPTLAELRGMYVANIRPETAEWYMSGIVYEHIMGLEDSNGNKVLQPNYQVSPFGTLLGRPVHIVPCMKGDNGVAGTISFADFGEGYVVGTKGGVKMARSVELYFLSDEEALRWVLRIGGAPTKARTMTLADGRAVSPIVNGFDD